MSPPNFGNVRMRASSCHTCARPLKGTCSGSSMNISPKWLLSLRVILRKSRLPLASLTCRWQVEYCKSTPSIGYCTRVPHCDPVECNTSSEQNEIARGLTPSCTSVIAGVERVESVDRRQLAPHNRCMQRYCQHIKQGSGYSHVGVHTHAASIPSGIRMRVCMCSWSCMDVSSFYT